MSVAEVFSELRGRGVMFTPEGDRLRWQAPKGAMTPELMDTLRLAKADILILVSFVVAMVDVFAGGRTWIGYPGALADELAGAGLPDWPWPHDRLRQVLEDARPLLLEHRITVEIHAGRGGRWVARIETP